MRLVLVYIISRLQHHQISTCAYVCPHCSWAGVWRKESRERLWQRLRQESRPQRQWLAASSPKPPFPGARSPGEKQNLAKPGTFKSLKLHLLLWKVAWIDIAPSLAVATGAIWIKMISPFCNDLTILQWISWMMDQLIGRLIKHFPIISKKFKHIKWESDIIWSFFNIFKRYDWHNEGAVEVGRSDWEEPFWKNSSKGVCL